MPGFCEAFQITWQVAKIKRRSKKIVQKKYYTTADYFQEVVKAVPDKGISFISSGSSTTGVLGRPDFTYSQLDRLSNQFAHWFLAQGIRSGSVVPLVMNNCPEYLAIWLGLAKVGAAAALINTNLREQSLVHCVKTAFEQSKTGPTLMILGDDLTQILTKEVQMNLVSQWSDLNFQTYSSKASLQPGQAPVGTLNHLIAEQPSTSLNPSVRSGVTYADPLYYIYTSGTTGLPKAAKIPHLRFILAGYAFATLYSFEKSDKMYVPLPIYHSNGGMVGVSSSWAAQISLVIREKFSAGNYFEDCRQHQCSLGVYIGECCRYILNTPDKENDRQHPVRLMVGNGLRPEIWSRFVDRFGVRMGEFYGSTEGNANLFNPIGKVGAVGYLPGFLKKIYPVKFIKVDPDTGAPIRDPITGLCLQVEANEPGELVGLINNKDATRRFDGYTNKRDSEKKIITDVCKKGDSFFRTGDLLKFDREGYVYFVDRLGDTFRWCGENVATTEVARVLGQVPGVTDVNVYGVKVGEMEGRAGMAAINSGLFYELDCLYQTVTRELPKYARPLFLRELPGGDHVTGTFKHKKTDLVKEGFNPELILGPVYFRSDIEGKYVPIDTELYQKIVSGQIRL